MKKHILSLWVVCTLVTVGVFTSIQQGFSYSQQSRVYQPLVPTVSAQQEVRQIRKSSLFQNIIGKYLLNFLKASNAQSLRHTEVHTRSVTLAQRMGYGITHGPVDIENSEIASLQAGFFLNWTVNSEPTQLGGAEYAQMIRIHQDVDCTASESDSPQDCPYAVPHTYRYSPNAETIVQAALAKPGSIWLLGNEIDRKGQDDILPTL